MSSELKEPLTQDKLSNNSLLDNNQVDVDILPKVGGNSVVVNICSCCVNSILETDEPVKKQNQPNIMDRSILF